jgi:hypothetical protein
MLRVGADKAGRKAKCHKCGTILTIPISSTVPPGADTKVSQRATTPPPLPPMQAPPPPPPVATFVTPLEEEIVEAPPRRRVAPIEAEVEEEPPRRERDYRDDEEEGPEPAVKKSSKAAQLWRARLGLLLSFIGTCVIAGAFAFELIGYLLVTIPIIRLMTSSRPDIGPPSLVFLTMWKIGLFVYLCGAICAITGYVFCMLGPTKKGAMGFSIATLSVAGLGLLMTLIFKISLLFSGPVFMPFGAPPPGFDPFGVARVDVFGSWFPLLLMQMLFSAELILFPLYLRALSKYLKASWNARRCMSVMVMACVYAGERLITLIFLLILLNMAFSTSRTQSDPKALIWILLILLWIGALYFIAFIVFYILSIWRTRAETD